MHSILLGDNVYLDKRHLKKLKSKNKTRENYYKAQWEHPLFAQLISQVPYFATWDDHDAGYNNVYPASIKKPSKEHNAHTDAKDLFDKHVINRQCNVS